MSKRKLSSLLFTLITLVIIHFFYNNLSLPLEKGSSISPTPLSRSSQKDTILGATDSAKVRVVGIIDGDTIEIEGGEKIRYIGINTPEVHHPTKGKECFGREASLKNKELVEGKEITIEKDVSETDRYGRLLRYVYVDGIMINDLLVRDGFAFASTFPPDVKYSEQFRQAEKEARENNRGLWHICST